MRVIGVFVNVLLLSALTAGAPLAVERIRPKTVFGIGRPTNDHVGAGSLLPAESPLSDQIPLSFVGGEVDGDLTKDLPLDSVVKSIRPIRYLKDVHAEVVIYLQEFSGVPIDTA